MRAVKFFSGARRCRMSWCCVAVLTWFTGAAPGLAAPEPKTPEPKNPATKAPGMKGPEPYRLKAGDEIAIGVLPRKEYDTAGVISPDGLLYLKGVGPIRAEGLTVLELEARVKAALEKELRRPRVTATLVKVAQLIMPPRPKVTVVGAVGKPGPVELEEGLRLRKAIDLAGGPTEAADLRRVILTHKDLTRSVLDLATAEASNAEASNPEANRLLQDGDSIEVPPRPKVTVVGVVAKPGTIPLEEGLRVRKALELAGGTGAGADLQHVVVIRKDLTRMVVDLSTPERVSDPASNRLLEDGDSVEVTPLFNAGSVSIHGAVLNPGSYDLKPGWTVQDLIVAAGRVTPVADLENLQLRRKTQPVRTISLLQQQAQGVDGIIRLETGDTVFVPEQKDKVVLIGPITDPGLRALKPGQTISEFFTRGPASVLSALDSSKVDLKGVRVIRAGKETTRLNLREVLGKPNHKQNVVLQSGDVIFLPPLERDQSMRPIDYLRALPLIGALIGF